MKRLVAVAISLAAVSAAIIIPAQPASAHHVCIASAKTPGFIDQKLGLIYGEASVSCPNVMVALYVDSYVLMWSNRAQQWVQVSEGHYEENWVKSVWTDAYYDCTGQILTLMTKGTSLAVGEFHWSDRDDDARSGHKEFVCGSSGGGLPLLRP